MFNVIIPLEKLFKLAELYVQQNLNTNISLFQQNPSKRVDRRENERRDFSLYMVRTKIVL